MNRRQFLKTSGAAVAAGVLAGCSSSWRSTSPLGRPIGANGDIRVAVIGFNAHGKSHIRAYKNIPGVRLVALCDVDDRVLQSQAAELEKACKLGPKTHSAFDYVYESLAQEAATGLADGVRRQAHACEGRPFQGSGVDGGDDERRAAPGGGDEGHAVEAADGDE